MKIDIGGIGRKYSYRDFKQTLESLSLGSVEFMGEEPTLYRTYTITKVLIEDGKATLTISNQIDRFGKDALVMRLHLTYEVTQLNFPYLVKNLCEKDFRVEMVNPENPSQWKMGGRYLVQVGREYLRFEQSTQ
jgi:hypothetical protein